MPKGQPGCFECGDDTELVVQVWLREFLHTRDSGRNRSQKTVDSVARFFCEAHARARYAAAAALIPANPRGAEGCRLCGAKRPDYRVQAWLRGTRKSAYNSVASTGINVCKDCVDGFYLEVLDAAALDPGTLKLVPANKGTDLAGARAAAKKVRTGT